MTSGSRLFGVGIAGASLEPDERAILEAHPPRAVILFRRNIESERQLADLVADIRSLPAAPFLCVDQEGGPVDRLKDLAGPFPSFYRAARAGLARRAGELAGEACAALGFDVDLAPVVDRRCPGAGEAVLGERAAAEDPAAVVSAGADFLAGLESRGVAGCLKHFPGLGRAQWDTHEHLPFLPPDEVERQKDLAPFRALHRFAGAVMVAHAAGEDDRLPGTLSRRTATLLLREEIGFEGVAFSDDLEMGALDEFGGLPERSAAAAAAGCDLVFVCSRLEVYPECVAKVEAELSPDRRDEAMRRIDAYAERLVDLRRAAVPPRPLSEISADVAALSVELGVRFSPDPGQ